MNKLLKYIIVFILGLFVYPVYGQTEYDNYRPSFEKALGLIDRGNYDSAIQTLEGLAVAVKKEMPEEKYFLIQIRNIIADCYTNKGQLSKALTIFLENKETLESQGDTITSTYLDLLGGISLYYVRTGDYPKAMDYCLKCKELHERTKDFGKTYAVCLANCAAISSLYQEWVPAKLFIDHALYVAKECGDLSTNDFYLIYSTAIPIYYHLGYKSQARELLEKAISETQQNNVAYAYLIDQLAQFEFESGHYSVADSLYEQALAIPTDRQSNFRIRLYQLFMQHLSGNASYLQNSRTLSDDIKKDAWQQVKFMKSEERYKYWHQYYVYLQNINGLLAANSDNADCGLIYDNVLFFRGFLQRAHSYAKGGSKEYIHETYWKDVSRKLKSDEIAVEFILLPKFIFTPDTNYKETYYAALTIKQNSHTPHITIIGVDTHIEKFLKEESSTKLFLDVIWSKLKDEFTGVKNIYFVPDGILCNIPIEYADFDDKEIKAIRLSSTRELCTNDYITNSTHSFVLYGGLKYKSDHVTMQINEKESTNNKPIQKFRATFDDISETTKQEVDNIKTIIADKGYDVKTYSGFEGTKSSFLSLSGTRFDHLHIATHGFYYTIDKLMEDEGTRSRLLTGIKDKNSAEEFAFERAGLLMSGLEHVVQRNDLEYAGNDGILTGNEIKEVDLSNVQLVTLSACETGLGEQVGVEGVYGLPRAFKLAGAKSILMALWKVDSDATQLLMTEFYRHYLDGEGKHMALKKAQDYLKTYELEDHTKPYESPEYWAAFVLLDAMD